MPEDFSNARFGDEVTFGPLVAIELRRRKFHKALTLKIPLPNGTTPEHDVRLMCSLAGIVELLIIINILYFEIAAAM